MPMMEIGSSEGFSKLFRWFFSCFFIQITFPFLKIFANRKFEITLNPFQNQGKLPSKSGKPHSIADKVAKSPKCTSPHNRMYTEVKPLERQSKKVAGKASVQKINFPGDSAKYRFIFRRKEPEPHKLKPDCRNREFEVGRNSGFYNGP